MFDGSDSNDGSMWELAKQTVTAGIEAVVSGDEIWVAKGIYIEQITPKLDTALYGGFTGGETCKTQQNWTINITILDENQVGSVVTASQWSYKHHTDRRLIIRNGNSAYFDGGGI